jgi:peptide/nickel transport system permease protein
MLRARLGSLRFLKFRKSATFGLFVLAAFAVIAIIAPYIAPYNPYAVTSGALVAPSSTHVMGTDYLGRDVFSMVLIGARPILLVALIATLTSGSLGIAIGSTAGYLGGKIDSLLMRITEFLMVIPRFFLALVIVVLWGSHIVTIALVIGVLSWASTARIARSEFLQLREQNFVVSAIMAGQNTMRTIFSEILPNAMPSIVTNMTLGVADAILTYTGFAFLGFGDPNQISWGDLLNQAQAYLLTGWWVAFFPGLMVVLVVVSSVFLGDGLNEWFNPRIKSEVGGTKERLLGLVVPQVEKSQSSSQVQNNMQKRQAASAES